MSHEYAYGMWIVVAFNTGLFLFFFLSFLPPKGKLEWRNMGLLIHTGHPKQGSYPHHGTTVESKTNTDPVCGKSVEYNQKYGKMHEGHLYHFFSQECLNKFETNRAKYV